MPEQPRQQAPLRVGRPSVARGYDHGGNATPNSEDDNKLRTAPDKGVRMSPEAAAAQLLGV